MSANDPRDVDERRGTPRPASTDELLQQLPARVLLDRLPTPMIGLQRDGVFAYANPACVSMLGYEDATAFVGQPLVSLLLDPGLGSIEESVTMLTNAGSRIVEWRHADGFPIQTIVSSPLLLRADDPLLIFSISDVTELLWMQGA